MKQLFQFCLIALCLQTIAQTDSHWKNFYSRSQITSIVPEGNTLWIGTTQGGVYQTDLNGNILAIFDVNSGLPTNNITSIAIDSNGNKWCGSNIGLLKYDGGNWTKYTTLNGLINNSIRSLSIDTLGSLWIGTDNGISKYDGKSWTTYLTGNSTTTNPINTLYRDNQGNMWCGTNNGASKFDGTNWTTYTTNDGLAHNYIYSIANDQDGNVWFGTWNGITKFDGLHWNSFKMDNTNYKNVIHSIFIDDSGTKWFGTNAGVYKLVDTTWTTYTTDNGLPDNSITCITKDNTGKKWFGTYKGVSAYYGINWNSFYTNMGILSNSINAIAIDSKNNKWFGYKDKGFSKFTDTTWNYNQVYFKIPVYGMSSMFVYAIDIDSLDTLWMASSGVAKYNELANATLSYSAIPTNDLNVINVDNKGKVWAGGPYGRVLEYYNNNTRLIQNLPTYSAQITAIKTDQDGIKWVGSGGDGVNEYNNYNLTLITTTDGLISNTVTSIAVDKNNNKWFGTNKGVSKLSNGKWQSFTTKDGLISDTINCIAVDMFNNIWFGTGKGLSKYDGIHWTSYTTKNGLVNNWITTIAIDNIGNKWIGTNNGLSVFNENGVNISYPFPDTLSRIRGRVYFDHDSSGTFTLGDSYLKAQKILLLPDSIICFTNNYGEYVFVTDSGKNYTINVIPQNNYTIGSESPSINITLNSKDSTLSPIGLYAPVFVSKPDSTSIDVLACGNYIFNNITYNQSGNYIQTYKNKLGNDSIVSLHLTINRPTIKILSEGKICLGTEAVFQLDSMALKQSFFAIDSVLWNFGDGSQTYLSKNTKATHVYTAELLAPTVIATAYSTSPLKNVCSNTDTNTSIDIKNAKASFDFISTQITCKAAFLTLKPQTFLRYNSINWMESYNDSITNKGNFDNTIMSLSFQKPGKHTIQYIVTSNYKGCELDSITKTFIIPNSVFNISSDKKEGFINESITFNIIDSCNVANYSHYWGFGDGTLDDLNYKSIHTFKQKGVYIIHFMVNNGCSDFDTTSITIHTFAGDTNGNGIIDGNEIPGDINGNGIIDYGELYGDLNGDGIINNGEITGVLDINGCSMSIFPIPVIDNLTIRFKDACNASSITIINSMGQIIYMNQKPYDYNTTIDMRDKASGSYIVQVIIDSKSYSTEVIKK